MLNVFNEKSKLKNYNLYLFIIYIFWIISLILFYSFSEYIKAGSLENGVKLGNDSHFYLREAANIIAGKASIMDYKSKFGYIFFLLPFVYFEVPLVFIVFIQILLTGLAAWHLYRIASTYFCKLSGIICIALFLFYFPLQIRNFYILTEMLFIDLTIILTYFLVFYKRSYISVIFLLICTLISIRPNGILYLFSILICTFIFFIRYKKYFFLTCYLIILLISIIPIINLLNSYMADLDLIDGINTKGIVWGWSFENNRHCEYDGPCLSIEFINNNYQNTIFGIFQFIWANILNFFYVFILKIFWLIVRIRPYYSDLHNFYLLIFNLILYPGFIYGFIKRPKNNFSLNVIIFFIVLSLILVGLTFADWSGRFSLYFLPLIMIFSSYGILTFTKKVFKFTKEDN